MSLFSLRTALKAGADKEQAKNLQRFFKTGPGEYGEGDIFLGFKVPVLRSIAKQHLDLTFDELQNLIESPIHEERMAALMILVLRFPKSTPEEKNKIFKFYIKNSKNINNWDLVDLSAPQIVGGYLIDRDKNILNKLSSSKNLWEKRISILATFQFIKEKQFDTALTIAEKLLNDEHDLIHKAVGWMLREIGKRDLETEEDFLKGRYKNMPRTMLRYAIEKFPEKKRKAYLNGTI
ncbi:MAG: DNA alkylation repair protein [Ignavibacteriaceae bacterium]|nr:DNA alkylation repair protein [Ignavibacteriaceae bacterium]